MNVLRMFLYLLHFFLWFVQESHSDRGFCRGFKPVVNICTDHAALATYQRLFLDTVNVPRFQNTSCECIIFPFDYNIRINVEADPEGHFPNGMQFEINDTVINRNVTGGWTYLMRETLIYFSNAEDLQLGEGTCFRISGFGSSFNITCMIPATHVANTTASLSSSAITEISKDNITASVTTQEPATEATTESRSNGYDSSANIPVIVVPVVVGILVMLAATVLIHVYIRRRTFLRHTQEPCMADQGQGRPNNPENKEYNIDVPVKTYERLNMYVNDTLAGEMYQQLNADKTEDNQGMYEKVTETCNQNKNVTKQRNLPEAKQDRTRSNKEQMEGHAKGQGSNSNGKDCDTDIAATEYERLNMYVNDNLAGEMYEQLDGKRGGDHRGNHVAAK